MLGLRGESEGQTLLLYSRGSRPSSKLTRYFEYNASEATEMLHILLIWIAENPCILQTYTVYWTKSPCLEALAHTCISCIAPTHSRLHPTSDRSPAPHCQPPWSLASSCSPFKLQGVWLHFPTVFVALPWPSIMSLNWLYCIMLIMLILSGWPKAEMS